MQLPMMLTLIWGRIRDGRVLRSHEQPDFYLKNKFWEKNFLFERIWIMPLALLNYKALGKKHNFSAPSCFWFKIEIHLAYLCNVYYVLGTMLGVEVK